MSRMDPDFLFELLTRIRAEADHQAAEDRRNKRKGSRAGSGGRNVVDAELSEIE